MKATRTYLLVVCLVAAGLCLVNLITLTGYFHSVESGDSNSGGEKRTLAQLQNLHQQLSGLEEPEMAKRLIRSFESVSFSTSGDGAVKEFRQSFAPVIAAFASKPREAEGRFLIVKKRELMENLVNAYRKEIPNGRIPLRAAYLNILFDLQNSLLNDSDEMEQVFIRRNKERFTALRSMVGGDQALDVRIGNLESIFQAIEKSVDTSTLWRKNLKQALATTEKNLPGIAREFQGSKGEKAEDQRRFFLYCGILGLAAFLFAFIVLYLNHKVLKLRFASRVESFLRILNEFGRERLDSGYEKELQTLRDDPDWEALAEGTTKAEADFVEKYQALLAVPTSITSAYFVLGKDKIARHWNKEAKALFQLGEKTSVGLDDIINTSHLAERAGETTALVELVRGSFGSITTDVFDLSVSVAGKSVPHELLAFPVLTGHLAGGKVYFFREIRSETERVEKAVTNQLAVVREYVHKLSHGYESDSMIKEGQAKEVKKALLDLERFKGSTDERELLWKTETNALLDQVSRQREYLEKLGSELARVREAHGKALQIVSTIHGGDESWHGEVCAFERELDHWKALREQLAIDLERHAKVMLKAKVFERDVRHSAEEMKAFLAGYDKVLEEIRSFGEEAKINAVNMGFTKDSAQREFAARSRAFAHDLTRVIDQAGKLAEKVQNFLVGHPASDLAAHLESEQIDPALLPGLKEEQERLEASLKRWRSSGSTLVAGGEQALALLREAEKQSAVLSQLGETSLLINGQAKENLQRWN